MGALRRPQPLGLRSGGNGVAPWVRRGLVVAQIAVSVVLLSASSLLVRSFWNLQNQNLGVVTRGVMAVRTSMLRPMDFWLQAEDLPHPNNRVYYKDGKVHLDLVETNPEALKPGSKMPATNLSGPDLLSLTAYLETLR